MAVKLLIESQGAALSIKQTELVNAALLQFVKANRNVGMDPGLNDLERACDEAIALVLSGDLTDKDLNPTRFDITEYAFQSYEVYQPPRGE